MCPICLVNLRKAAGGTMRVRDISEYLAEAVTAGQARPAQAGNRSA